MEIKNKYTPYQLPLWESEEKIYQLLVTIQKKFQKIGKNL